MLTKLNKILIIVNHLSDLKKIRL